ncbi:MAG: restriction endonuclease subunit S [Neglectibacter timonensis]|jgi:type I restriction enzyme S subunit|nr:restriction endonuclease subunit S [uncultured Dysosmobacter sp.]
MKSLKTKYGKLIAEQRWDIDYHLPPIEIRKYNPSILQSIGECAEIITDKRNPTSTPDEPFLYVDISSVDVTTGMITNPQQLLGEEAPSRARKVIREGDIIISTCRPTRGAVAVVPKELDNQICSTGFSVIRAKESISNQYLHFMLRSPLVREQFRKFSTGSSYPAILDEDIKKTVIPLPEQPIQDQIAEKVHNQTLIRNQKITTANKEWSEKLSEYMAEIEKL